MSITVKYFGACWRCREKGKHTYSANVEIERLGWLLFDCECGGDSIVPHNSPDVQEEESADGKIEIGQVRRHRDGKLPDVEVIGFLESTNEWSLTFTQDFKWPYARATEEKLLRDTILVEKI